MAMQAPGQPPWGGNSRGESLDRRVAVLSFFFLKCAGPKRESGGHGYGTHDAVDGYDIHFVALRRLGGSGLASRQQSQKPGQLFPCFQLMLILVQL